jgi:hypothetical protein
MKKYKKKVKGPMDDLMKDMPGWKADDCQWVMLNQITTKET